MTKPITTYGKLCKNHPDSLGARNPSGRCIACSYAYKNKWETENKERLLLKRKQYSIDKKLEISERSKKWREENPKRAFELAKKYRANNIGKIAKQKRVDYLSNPSKKHAAVARWNVKNRDKCASYTARHRSAKLSAYVSWANDILMKEIYSSARLIKKIFGGKWEVDHIVPLQSDIVCGLHWEGNLRMIPKRENQSKSNRLWPDMPTLDASGGTFTIT